MVCQMIKGLVGSPTFPDATSICLNAQALGLTKSLIAFPQRLAPVAQSLLLNRRSWGLIALRFIQVSGVNPGTLDDVHHHDEHQQLDKKRT